MVFDTSFERSRICEDIHLLAVITSMFHSSLQYEINNISFLLKYRIYVTILRPPKQIKKSWRKPKRCQVTPKNIYNKSVDFSCSLALHHLFHAKKFLHNTKKKQNFLCRWWTALKKVQGIFVYNLDLSMYAHQTVYSIRWNV